jgi:hypothetical protein
MVLYFLHNFLSVKQAISFFIHFKYFRKGTNVHAVNLGNEKTGEKIVVKKDDGDDHVTIVTTSNECGRRMD